MFTEDSGNVNDNGLKVVDGLLVGPDTGSESGTDELARQIKKMVRREEKKSRAPVLVDRDRPVRAGKSVQALAHRHREIARMAATGATNAEIAEKTGLTYGTVACVKSSTPVKAQIAQLQTVMDAQVMEARSRIHEMLPAACMALEQILNPENDQPFDLQLRAATTVMGISGLVAPRNVNVNQKTAVLTGDDLAKLQQRAQEHQQTRDIIINA